MTTSIITSYHWVHGSARVALHSVTGTSIAQSHRQILQNYQRLFYHLLEPNCSINETNAENRLHLRQLFLEPSRHWGIPRIADFNEMPRQGLTDQRLNIPPSALRQLPDAHSQRLLFLRDRSEHQRVHRLSHRYNLQTYRSSSGHRAR